MVVVVESSLVAQNGETPKHESIWLSNLDFNVTSYHIPVVYIYRNCNGVQSVVAEALKAALADALVPFYPLAGRLGVDPDGRNEIKCTGEGAIFVVARSDRNICELGDFAPSPEMMQLVPLPGPSYSPALLLAQITFFKCNGMTLGIATHHLTMDGHSAMHFTTHWCKIARGIVELDVPPFLDRTVLRSRSPPNPDLFYAIGYNPNSTSTTAAATRAPVTTTILKLSRNQVALLKNRSEQQSTFQAITAHAWRGACLARKLAPNRMTRVYLVADVRTRLKPALPRGYFGNAICRIAAAATSEEIVSKPITFGAHKLQDAIDLMTDEYARSVIDYIELAGKNERRTDWLGFSDADLLAISWLGMRFQQADFGWGRPEFMGKAISLGAGKVYVVSGTDGGVSVSVSLETENMERFKKVFYQGLEE